jgi:hypothetical protein
MALIREGTKGEVEEFGLEEFANAVNGLEKANYDQKGQKPLVWFNILLISGQFERVRPAIASRRVCADNVY